ncbi:optineurin isoform X1 [Hypanus sabinus]|uniref:optineurin isoform X1 n=1 Tax=Hypanus sabinus TaxID=79690 RepID=UPI0028C4EF66|nr:optineurin isoform X1 [Hypanus sabinus]XP_059843262.1 optineurin isoform X1 [Hypanus sabinus]XP_059843263.1 optineurin isoform X1 [Hypanus sabinus]
MTTNHNGSLQAVNGTANINGPHSLDTCTPEETLRLMEELIKENNELKEAIKQTNHTMKERYEELTNWCEKQKLERECVLQKFEEAKQKLTLLTEENEALKKSQAQNIDSSQGISKDDLLNKSMSSNLVEQDVQHLKAQIHRLQTEKADLVAMNSELLVKLGTASSEDSFVEIRMVEAMDDAELKSKELECKDSDSPLKMSKSHDNSEKCLSEELTVRQLLHMLRDKTVKLENLEHELQSWKERISELSKDVERVNSATQTEENAEAQSFSDADQGSASEIVLVDVKEENSEIAAPAKESNAANQNPNEVEVLKSQVMSLVKDLQEVQSKLDEAEDMKKSLQARCLELEQKLASNQVVMEDVKQLNYSNEKLKLQVESLQSEEKILQSKLFDEKVALAEEKRKLTQMQAAYDTLFKDYGNLLRTDEEMKIRESKQKETLSGLTAELTAAKRTMEENQKTVNQLQQTVAQQAEQLSVQKAQNATLVDISAQLEMAEKALVEKQQKIDVMKQTIIKQEEEMETVAVFKAQAEVYSADFHAERAARETIHAEKEAMAERLDRLMKENTQLKEELDTLGSRQSLAELQRRHGSCGPMTEGDDALQQQGVREPRSPGWQHQGILPDHACPKCGIVLPDIDTLQIHVMDCII